MPAEPRRSREACRRLVRNLTVALLLLGADRSARASDKDFQIWSPTYLTLSFSEAIQGWYEVQPRFGSDASEVSQLILRTALGYRFTDAWSAWLGYAWTPNLEPRFASEHRLYQQLLYAGDLARTRLTSRTRLEQRGIDGVSGTAVRFRTLLRGQHPLHEARRWSLVAQDEIFVNLNSPDGGPRAGFDQNRFFAGLNWKISEFLNVDAGYQLQVTDSAGVRFPARVNHVLLLQIFLSADVSTRP